jgi:hypothetical protein
MGMSREIAKSKRFAHLMGTILTFCTLGLAPLQAEAEPVIVGVNLVNEPYKLSPEQQESILQFMHKSGIRIIRSAVPENDQGLAYAQRVYSNKIQILLQVYCRGSWPTPAESPNHVCQGGHLSDADPEAFRAYFEPFFAKLEEKGMKFAGIELGNEINWSCFNADFQIPGQGKIFGSEFLNSNPAGKKVAEGFKQYIKNLAVLKDIRDHSKINKDTPIISAGLALGGSKEGPSFKVGSVPMDGVSLPASLEFFRKHGIDQYVDGYGVHQYFSANDDAAKRADSFAKIENITFSQCGPASKPAWVTEWGSQLGVECPVDDKNRLKLMQDVRNEFGNLAAQGKIKAIFLYTWQGKLNAAQEDRYSAVRCGALTKSGALAIEPLQSKLQSSQPQPRTKPAIIYKNDGRTANSMKSDTRWHEFFHSPSNLMKRNTSYNISFAYAITAKGPKVGFYTLLRSASNKQKALPMQKWNGEHGNSGRIEFQVSTEDSDDYYLIIGIENRGAIDVRNIVIERL